MGTWTPLITSTMFDGIKADLLTGTAGLMTLGLVILGGGILLRVLMR